MKRGRELVMAGKAAAGAGLTGAVAYLVATAPTHVHVYWPYGIFGTAVLLGIGLYFAGQEHGPATDQDDDGLGTRQDREVRNRQGVTPDAAGRLLGPRDGSEVTHKEAVSGVVVGLPPGAEAWILVRPAFEGTYWPQRNLLLDQTGSFQAVAQFGRSGTQDIGGEYALLLVMAPPNARARFREFQGKDASEGLPELPPDVVTLARAIVTRR